MALLYGCLTVIATIILKAESQPASGSSSFPRPQPPQVLLNAMKLAPSRGTAPGPNPLENLLNVFGSRSNSQNPSAASSRRGNNISMPVTANMKVLVNKWATQMGHKAYYEAHGCVDPSTTLHGRNGQLAGMALMMGCNNFQASEVCEMAQVAHAGGQGANMRSMMEMMLGKDMKHMLEECLTPSTLMNGVLGSMLPAGQQKQSQSGFVPPSQASAKSKSKAIDCSSVTQMLMISAANEGLLNPEAMEQIGVMRNRYFKMTCQENMILGSLPYRLCCPGYVKPPTMQEAMMLQGMGGV